MAHPTTSEKERTARVLEQILKRKKLYLIHIRSNGRKVAAGVYRTKYLGFDRPLCVDGKLLALDPWACIVIQQFPRGLSRPHSS